MLEENGDLILKWLVDDAVSFNHSYEMFEYFSEQFSIKSVVWTQESVIRFAFMYYLVRGYKYTMFPVESDQELTSKMEIVYTIITSLYDKAVLKDSVKAEVKELQNEVGATFVLPDKYLEMNFEYFNKKLIEIKLKEVEPFAQEDSVDIEEINNQLYIEFKDIQPFKLNTKMTAPNKKHIIIRPMMLPVSSNYLDSVVQLKKYQIIELLNSIIKNTIQPLTLGFDSEGVTLLLSALQKGKYKFRNYTYVDDWALGDDVHASKEFSLLKEEVGKIPFDQYSTLHEYVFLKEGIIPFNAYLTSFTLEKPDEETCRQFIQQYKIADGKYCLDGAVFMYPEALQFVYKKYRIEKAEIDIETEITSDDGIRILFKRGSI